jgi:hypothetical protein
MKFDESGLPPVKLIRDAFDYAQKSVLALHGEELRNLERQIARFYQQQMTILQQKKAQKILSEEAFALEVKKLDGVRAHNVKIAPMRITAALENTFAQSHLAPAQIVFKTAEGIAPEAIAAVLLMECVRSMRDFADLQREFGPVVTNLMAEIQHIESYPMQRLALLEDATPVVKRIHQALTINALEGVAAQAESHKRAHPDQIIAFPPGQEMDIFSTASRTWKTDAKLDTRLMDTFNRTAEKVQSKFRFDNDEDGNLKLVRLTPPTPPKPPGPNVPALRPPKPPGGDGSVGDSVF